MLGAEQLALLRVLVRHDVEFIVIGGVAAQVRGWSAATRDLDIAVSVSDENRARLDLALREIVVGEPLPGPIGTTFRTRHCRLEIISRADGIGTYEQWREGAERVEVAHGLEVDLAAPLDILRSKAASGRQKDFDALPQMRRDFIASGAVDPGDISGEIADEVAPPTVPAYITDLLGSRPTTDPGRWELVAEEIHRFRSRWSISGGGLGPEGGTAEQRAQRRGLAVLIERFREKRDD